MEISTPIVAPSITCQGVHRKFMLYNYNVDNLKEGHYEKQIINISNSFSKHEHKRYGI